MVVAKRQGRSEDQSEDFRQSKQNKQHSWLSPICIGQAQVEEKTYKKRSQSTFSPTLCDLMDCSILGFPVLHHLPEEFVQTNVH